MFQAIPVHENNIFAYKVTGKLTDDDYRQFLPELTQLIQDYGPISLLVELEDFQGWEFKAALDDFEYGREHEKDFIKIAIVTDNSWQKKLAKIASAFTNVFFETKVKTFDRDDLQKAWNWLREEENNELIFKPYSSIAVAVDFSEHSDYIINRAVELARHYNASLSLIHAVEHIPPMYTEYDVISSSNQDIELERALFDNASEQLEKIANNIDFPNIKYQVLWGSPKSTVLSYASAQNVDLIVTGSHGKHGLARLLGSTAQGIMQSAQCDVLVVKFKIS